MRNIPAIFIVIFSLFACSQKKQIVFPPPVLDEMHYPGFIEACDVPKYTDQLVYTRLLYSGFEEYWSLHPDKKCDFVNAEFDISDNIFLSKENVKMLQNVHNKYWNHYLIIDVIGIYQTGKTSGYGHLGHNKANFLVKKIINIQEVVNEKAN